MPSAAFCEAAHVWGLVAAVASLDAPADSLCRCCCCCCCCRRSGLTPEAFRQQYEAANCPVVLTDAMGDWPALAKWDRQYLTAALAGRPVRPVPDLSCVVTLTKKTQAPAMWAPAHFLDQS
jgi:hypothetical protein